MAKSRDKHRVTGQGKRTKKQTAPEQNSETEIWSSMLDGRYTVAVYRLAPYRGELTILDGIRLLHRQKVALMYGTVFGPDVDDTTLVDGLQEPPEVRTEDRSTGGPVA